MTERVMQKFLDQERPPNPIYPSELYARYQKWLEANRRSNRQVTYLSTTMTSGGYARIDKKDIGQVIRQNTLLSEALLEHLISQGYFNGQDLLVFPPDIGSVEGWGEADYLTYWIGLIAGMPVEKVTQLERQIKTSINTTTVNNHHLTHEERRRHYADLVKQAIGIYNLQPDKNQPVGRVVQLLDPPSSLGCYAEQSLALSLGIPIYEVVINCRDGLEQSVWQELSTLLRYGSVIPNGRIRENDKALAVVRQLTL